MAGLTTALPYPLVGFRKDRSGARLIGVLDMIRLSRKFGVEARFLWLSQPDGPWPELADPAVFFGAAVLADHIRVIHQAPDLSDRKALSSVAHRLQVAQFAQSLAEGGRFYGGHVIEAARFGDETPAQLTAELREIMLALPLAPRLEAALNHARQVIAAAGRKNAAAIHVRRGDILDGTPWSYRAWPSKYVPDEYFRQFVALRDGPVIAFSDTPAAVKHLAQGDPRILPVDDLLAAQELTLPERDMLELLLMAECEVVAAPSASAFSQAAAMIGGVRVQGLPMSLPGEDGRKAHDNLLRRVVVAPDSFFAPGDLAQSLVYATQHAIAQGRAEELLHPATRPEGFQDRFPFVQYWQALAALAAGQRDLAVTTAEMALASPHLCKAERHGARQIIALSGLHSGAAGDHDGLFLTLAFAGGGGPMLPVLAHEVLGTGGAASQALMFSPGLVEKLAYAPESGVLAAMARIDGGEGMALPEWTYLSGWVELMPSGYERENLPRNPGMWAKIAIGGDLPMTVLSQLSEGATPATPDAHQAELLGFCAEKLGLHGRLRQAFALLHWLDQCRPGDALTHKRLADCCYLAGNLKAGQRWLDSAIDLAPQNALLRLSAAHRMIAQKRFDAAEAHLSRARTLWPGLGLIQPAMKKLKIELRKA